MKIGLVVTGGTLDSSPSPNGLRVAADGGVFDHVQSILLPGQSLVQIASPWRIDSSQLQSVQILELAAAIRSAPVQDAWIIAAGTDTLAWLAPGLWWLLGDLACPVLLVSGMLPWWHPSSDGAENLHFALRSLHQGCPNGLHLATANRLIPPYHVRKISHGAIDPFRMLPTRRTNLQSLAQLMGQVEVGIHGPLLSPPPAPALKAVRTPSVLWLPVHPGIEPVTFRSLLEGSATRHLVLSAYSGGTLPRWLFDEIPETVQVHLTSQQWGPLALEEYEASAHVQTAAWKCWSLAPETVTSLLALADALGLEAQAACTPLSCLQSGLFAA